MDELTQWLLAGERGGSSETMVAHITGIAGMRAMHPHDPDDFRRCRLLVERVPMIRGSLPKMASCSAEWARIIARWDDLCALMDSETPEWRQGVGSAPQTYKLLRDLRAGEVVG